MDRISITEFIEEFTAHIKHQINFFCYNIKKCKVEIYGHN